MRCPVIHQGSEERGRRSERSCRFSALPSGMKVMWTPRLLNHIRPHGNPDAPDMCSIRNIRRNEDPSGEERPRFSLSFRPKTDKWPGASEADPPSPAGIWNRAGKHPGRMTTADGKSCNPKGKTGRKLVASDPLISLVYLWSGWRDSNSRPLAPHASALPGCATPRRAAHYNRAPALSNMHIHLDCH